MRRRPVKMPRRIAGRRARSSRRDSRFRIPRSALKGILKMFMKRKKRAPMPRNSYFGILWTRA